MRFGFIAFPGLAVGRLAALAGLALLAACSGARARTHGATDVETIARYRTWGVVHRSYGVDPLTEDQARGRWHWQLHLRGGLAHRAVEITPTGATFRTREIEYASDGAVTVHERDQWGRDVATRTIDPSGTEIVTARSVLVGDAGCHHRRLVADSEGRLVEVTCLDAFDRPTMSFGGCERGVVTRDAHGRPALTRCLRADGSPATYAAGHHQYRIQFDALGQEVLYEYLDDAGRPVAKGCAKAAQTFHPNGLVTRQRCTDASGAFVIERRTEYDANGCVVSTARADEQGEPAQESGVSTTLFRRDERCAELRRETRGLLGELVGKPAIRDVERDAYGRVVLEACTDSENQPVSCMSDAPDRRGALVRYTYDPRDRIARKRCYFANGEPSGCAQAYPHEERYEYGPDGRETSRSFLDAHGQPTLAMGAARVVFERDPSGRITSERFYGPMGNPVETGTGCHELRIVLDTAHRVAAVECRKTDGTLTSGTLCKGKVCFSEGAARVAVERVTNHKVWNVHYDASGKELARIDCDEQPCFR